MIDNILKDHLLRCPECNSELDYNNDEIIECSNNLCDNQYPIINEVPTFIDSTPKSSRGFEYQWKKRLNGNFEIDFSNLSTNLPPDEIQLVFMHSFKYFDSFPKILGSESKIFLLIIKSYLKL